MIKTESIKEDSPPIINFMKYVFQKVSEGMTNWSLMPNNNQDNTTVVVSDDYDVNEKTIKQFVKLEISHNNNTIFEREFPSDKRTDIVKATQLLFQSDNSTQTVSVNIK